MQISKTLLTCGAAALCLVAISARAVDTEADLKLREALRQRMAEVSPETSAPAPSKPAKVVKTPTPPAPVAPVAPTPVAPPVVKKPVAPVAPAPVVVQPAPVAAPAQPAPAAVDDAQVGRLREAVRARLALETANPTPPPQVVTHEPAVSTTKIVAPEVSTPAPVAAPVEPAPVVAPVVKAPVTMEAPALPISASKEQRLANLLQQYKSDQITPQQYHEQRAKILAE